MKLAAPLALCLLATACAGPRQEAKAKEGSTPRPDLLAVDRAILGIEAAELRGGEAAIRQGFAAQWEAKPTSPAARFLALYARTRDEATWAEFKAMSTDLPDSGLGWLGQARIYVAWKVWDQVDKVVDAGFDAEPDNWLLVIPRAMAAEGRGRFDQAASDWKMVLGVDPKNPEALMGRARAARRAGDGAGARSACDAALAASPGYFPALEMLAELSAEAGDKEGAARAYAQAIEANPRDRALRVTLAKLLTEKGDAAGARDQWKAILGLKVDPEALASYAAAARAAGDAKAEASAIEQLAKVDPGAAEWKRVAEIRMSSGDVAGAEAALRRTLARDPKDANANASLGMIQEGKGEYEAAIASYRAGGEAGRAGRTSLEQRLNIEPLSRPNIMALQKAAGALIEKTYKARVAEWPNLAGALKIRVTTDEKGAATLVEVLEDSVADPAVRACAYWNLRDATYTQKKPGRYTFVFDLRAPR
ncbi:MAG TPA: tetratricopeptide repeat protein [Anaeromyxobacteraceae bacterium]|nr:tetratricopeptide repeat protein [Anaeromyxobacteraceae bacterium]